MEAATVAAITTEEMDQQEQALDSNTLFRSLIHQGQIDINVKFKLINYLLFFAPFHALIQ